MSLLLVSVLVVYVYGIDTEGCVVVVDGLSYFKDVVPDDNGNIAESIVLLLALMSPF